MFNATYFTYDGKHSSEYGLMIADFENSSTVETKAFSPTLNTIKPATLNRFFHGGITYDSVPQYQFSILSQSEINASQRRQILAWLVGRSQFKQLKIHQEGFEDLYYNCVFTDAAIIYVSGRCHGFRVTANFDSPFARGASTSVTVTSGTHTVQINNLSNILDGYTYPIVQFTGGQVEIVNQTDDPSRRFVFSGASAAETITVDNELQYISSTEGGEKLSNFTSKNWLRLRPGANTLVITSAGAVTITCPQYVMIGF